MLAIAAKMHLLWDINLLTEIKTNISTSSYKATTILNVYYWNIIYF